MADWYFGSGGTDDLTGDRGQVESNPFLTYEFAQTQASAGDTIFAIDGDYTATTNYTEVSKDGVILSSANFRGGSIKPNGAQARNLRIGTGLTSANDVRVRNITIDGASLANSNLEIPRDTVATRPATYHFDSIRVLNGINADIQLDALDGRFEFTNLRSDSLINLRGLVGSSSLTSDGNQTIIVDGWNIEGSSMDADSVSMCTLTKVSAGANTLEVVLSGVRGTQQWTGTNNAYYLADITGADTVVISGWDVTVEAVTGLNDSYLVQVHGRDASTVTADPLITGVTGRFFADAGYGLAIGNSTTDSHVTGGRLNGNAMMGRYVSSTSPHLFMLGQATNGEMNGNVGVEGGAIFLASKTTNGIAEGNLAVNPWVVAYYMKGCTDFTYRRNVAVHNASFSQTGQGMLACNVQGVTNNLAGLFDENLVIVTDFSKVNHLAIKSAGQTCNWSNNIYVLPDTIDPDTVDLFNHEGTGNTITEWNAQTYVSNDRVVLLPQAEVNALAAHYESIAKGRLGGGGSIYRAFRV